MQDLRCVSCGRLLAKAIIHNGYIESKCPKCGYLNKFEFNEEDIVVSTSEHSLQASNKEKCREVNDR